MRGLRDPGNGTPRKRLLELTSLCDIDDTPTEAAIEDETAVIMGLWPMPALARVQLGCVIIQSANVMNIYTLPGAEADRSPADPDSSRWLPRP